MRHGGLQPVAAVLADRRRELSDEARTIIADDRENEGKVHELLQLMGGPLFYRQKFDERTWIPAFAGMTQNCRWGNEAFPMPVYA
jgi:hypothetical protein